MITCQACLSITRAYCGLERMDGLDAFDPATDRFRVYRASGDGLNQYQVIAEDSQGALWLGTQFTGLQRFDPSTGQFTIYRQQPWNWRKP